MQTLIHTSKNLVTPQESYPDLAAAIGIQSLCLKREDLHPLGSHKGRSIPHMIDLHVAEGIRHFAISSSGNAALAAALYVRGLNAKTLHKDPITLEIFAGKNINPKKLAKLQELKNNHILVSIQDRPLQMLFIKIKDPEIKSLRQSTDDTALVGYEKLAEELATIPDLRAIFIGTSSGTTAQALANYFLKNKKTTSEMPVEIHIVQTPTCHPLATAMSEALGETQDENKTNEISIADAIVDRNADRRPALVPRITQTGGTGWIVNNESLNIAREITSKHAGVTISPNSALSVAGLMSAVYTGKTWSGSVVCMICGE